MSWVTQKSKVGLAAAKVAALRINLNVKGCGSTPRAPLGSLENPFDSRQSPPPLQTRRSSASIPGTSVYLRPKWGRKIVRRPQRAQSDCPTTADRGAAPLSSGLSDAPWLNRRRPGSLYFWTLEMSLCGNVIIRKAPIFTRKLYMEMIAAHGGGPGQGFPCSLLSGSQGVSAVARVSDRGRLTEV